MRCSVPGSSQRLGSAGRLRAARLMAGVLIAAWAGVASAASWLKVADMSDGDALFVDTSSSKTQDATMSLTTLLVYGRPQLQGQGSAIQATRAQWEMRCQDRHYRYVSFTTHAGKTADSAVISRDSQPSAWSIAPPESMPAKLLRWACKP